MKNLLFKSVTRLVGKAIGDFGLIDDGDRILVALSGGKDSWTLLYTLKALRQRAPISYEMAAVTIHPGHDGSGYGPIRDILQRDGIPYQVLSIGLSEIVKEKLTPGTSPCSFCARLRRGVLYTHAASEGWNKIALGHHLDDFVETLLLNLFFNGSIKGMSPKLLADDGRNRIIRPLVYVREDMTRKCARLLGVPLLNCSCPYQGMLGGSRRHWMKNLLSQIEAEIPDVKSNLLTAMSRVRHRHLLTRFKESSEVKESSAKSTTSSAHGIEQHGESRE
jgi:tRNA 2-thiocytidine biosynthesis protein TtcA